MLSKYNQKWLRGLQQEWDFHNNKHHCSYENGYDYGVVCPSEFANFPAFLNSRGFPVELLDEDENDQISGQDSTSPNSRSDIAPVEDEQSLKDSITELETNFDRLEAQVRQIANENVPAVYERIAVALEAIAAAVERTNTPIIFSMQQSDIKGISREAAKEFMKNFNRYDRMENGIHSVVRR